MKLFQFIADDTTTALAQIHAQLGEHAVVVSVRPLPAEGVARFLPGRKRIEVVAGVPDESPADMERGIHAASAPYQREATRSSNAADPYAAKRAEARAPGATNLSPTLARLERAGLSAEVADRLQQELMRLCGNTLPRDPEQENALVRALITSHWKTPPALDDGGLARPHVFIGPPGSGKTTTLCKWLTLAVLTEDRSAKVWRLDGTVANTAELLSIHCEILGITQERFWSRTPGPADCLFIDLPGVEASDPAALTALTGQLSAFGMPRVHLVLNAAYDTDVLLAQARAFSTLEPEDVIFTHMDEVVAPVKLWNFLLNTNCSLRFLSGGQRIPGDFLSASAERLLKGSDM
jgi:flagellar biosynthesis protein FlhF